MISVIVSKRNYHRVQHNTHSLGRVLAFAGYTVDRRNNSLNHPVHGVVPLSSVQLQSRGKVELKHIITPEETKKAS